MLHAWLRSDRERGVTNASHPGSLDPNEVEMRLTIVTADIRERRLQHLNLLKKYFREVERHRKAALEKELMQDAKELLAGVPEQQHQIEEEQQSEDGSVHPPAPAEPASGAPHAVEGGVAREAAQVDNAGVPVKPIFQALGVTDNHYQKMTAKVQHSPCTFRRALPCHDV